MKTLREINRSLMFFSILINIITLCHAIDHPKRQMRAGWIASVSNIDWPSKPGLNSSEQKIEFIKLVKEAKDDNLNAIIVQIRPTADSFYPSKYFPWSKWLTGRPGLEPDYDPLEFMLKQTHDANLEFHAWFNPYRVDTQPDINKLAMNHPARIHPTWVVKYGDLLIFNPGLPEVRELVIAGIIEVVEKYDVDGIHFDDYFYPYPIKNHAFPDNQTYHEYGKNHFINIEDWRRNNTNVLINQIYRKINKVKPHVKFGISPFGVWRNIADDPTGSNTTAGVPCYDTLYADTRTWIRHEWIDYIVPQIYWLVGFKPAAYDVLVEWWDREVNNTNVQLYIGHAVTRVGSETPIGWKNPNVIEDQMLLNDKYLNIKGSVFWNMKHMIENKLNFKNILRSKLLSKPALIPQSNKDSESMDDKVVINKISTLGNTSIELHWSLDHNLQSNLTSYFLIYRFDSLIYSVNAIDISTANNILAKVKYQKHMDQTFIDETLLHNNNYTYFVSAVTRYHTEGPLSKAFNFIKTS